MQKDLFENEFKDVYLNETSDGSPVFCYRTGMTVYEEVFDKGRLVSAGWNTAGTPFNVLEGMPCRLDHDAFAQPWVFDVEIDGICIAYDWEYVGFDRFDEIGGKGAKLIHTVIVLKNNILPLEIEIHTILSGSAVFTRYLRLRNLSDRPMNVNKLMIMGGGLEIFYDWQNFTGGASNNDSLYSIGYMESASHCAEGLFRWRQLTPDGTSFSGRWPSDRHRYPAFMLRNDLLGKIWIAQMAYSGGFTFSFNNDVGIAPNGISDRYDRASAKLSFTMEISAPAPLIVLREGESFDTPQIYIGCVQGDLDDAVNMMHRHTRRAVFTHDDPDENLATVGAGIGPERAMTKEAVFHTIETASIVGAESCIIDAGWYCAAGKEGTEWWSKVGDWAPDKDKYGDDFRDIRRECHEKGLKFGLWMECERMGKDTAVAKAHPEWYQTRSLKGQDTTVIDMANPHAAAWVRSQIERVIDDYGVELFRTDYNVGYMDSVCRLDVDGVPESSYLRYYKALYEMYDGLRKKYPNVIFENCAGGGARCDLGMTRRFTHTWVSDYQIPPRCVAVTNGISMFIPPERIDRLVAGMNGHLRASLDFTVRAAMICKPSTNTYDPMDSEMNREELEFVKHSFDIYKSFIRPFMSDGSIYHHTPELYGIHPKGRSIIERASNDRKKGFIAVFNLVGTSPDHMTVYPRGIDEGMTYKVTLDNKRTSYIADGRSLTTEGIKIYLPVPLTSELILYDSVDQKQE